MNIIAVDDEMIALKNLELKLKEIPSVTEIHIFEDCQDALDYLNTNTPDAAFLDINMTPISGIMMAKKIKDICPSCAIIFLTGYSDYAVEAFSMKVSGYLMKPATIEDIQRELEYVQSTAQMKTPDTNQLEVHCFGNFDVFRNGESVKFSRSKSKELFAFLIDRRGASVTMSEIAAVLWDDGIFNRSRNNQIHSFLHELIKSLDAVDAKQVIIKKRNAISVSVSEVTCDYYQFLEGDPAAINSYSGEYMSQYWWAEFTAGELYSMHTDRN